MPGVETLWVVMPAYNEERAVSQVVREWSECLRRIAPSHVLCVLDDGSKDDTGRALDELSEEMPSVRIVHKSNSGHGQTCVAGYRFALENGADWIFQIDSDGQCDPKFFEQFWQGRVAYPVSYGYRNEREDGYSRFAISRIVSIVAFLATGIWVRDANVPYRLMRADSLRPILPLVPPDFHLANILVSVLQQRTTGIHWIPIHFRNRIAGSPSAKAFGFARRGWQLFCQLRALRSVILSLR